MYRNTPVTHVSPASAASPGVLVVHEGAHRLRWHTVAPDRWQLIGLWPDQADVDRLLSRVQRGEPVLVVLSMESPVVTVYEHEIRTHLDGFAAVEADNDIVELTVPCLEWLPEPLRARGLLFAEQANAVAASTPIALLPPLMVDDLEHDGGLRFALRTRTPLSSHRFADVACHLFASRLGLGIGGSRFLSSAGTVPSDTAGPVRRAS
ncbi:MAG: hypothetical protein ACRCYU_08565 [Nocardioides sp.]